MCQGESIGLVNRAKRGYGAVMLCRIAVDRRDSKTGLKTNTNKAGLADTIERQHLVKQLEKTLAGYAKNAVVYHERQTEKIALCGADTHKCTYGGCSDSSDPKAEDNEFALRGCTLDLPPALIDGEKIDKKEYEAMVTIVTILLCFFVNVASLCRRSGIVSVASQRNEEHRKRKQA